MTDDDARPLAGLDGTDVFLRPLLAALPPWVTPIVVRYPQEGANDYEHLLEVAGEAVRDLGEYWVLGWSFSGPLALELARRHGRRIRGVILCASFVRPISASPLVPFCGGRRRPVEHTGRAPSAGVSVGPTAAVGLA